VPANLTRSLHLWHDLPTGPNPPDLLNTIVEIPKDARNKYELDKATGLFRLDRVLHSAMHFPGDYGFLPRTLAEDGDPLDILVLMAVPVFTGCLIETRPVGIFRLVDKGENDEKILSVPVSDPYTRDITDLSQIPRHTLLEIEHFFLVYKDLEGPKRHQQVSQGFGDAAAARHTITECMARYAAAHPSG
jgi:inorganic pyrophosphatase